jgi:hypothetical protein
MTERLEPEGVLVVEDIDCSGHFCHPPSPAFSRYVEWYTKAAQARGCDPNIGPRLPGLLRDAGLDDVGVNVVHPAGLSGDVKLIGPITLENVAESIVSADLATPDEVQQTIEELYVFARAEGTLLSLPRMMQSWGRRTR